ncbi:hypothetical protein PG910_08840 [Tenacibaculum dicentrarchi]|nr:hypothetical protein PG910_08840 [Tenacibaculum dicentrarchi]
MLKRNLIRKKELDLENDKVIELKADLKVQLDRYNTELTEINKLRIDGSYASVIDKKLLDHHDQKLKEQEEILINKISELNKKHTEYINLITDLEAKKRTQEIEIQQTLNDKIKELETNFQEKFSSKENELNELEEGFKKNQRALSKKVKEHNYNIEDFEHEKTYLTDKARKAVESEIEYLNNLLETARDKNEKLKRNFDSLKEEIKCLGDDKPQDIKNKLRKTQSELSELREKLANNEGVLKIDELKRLQIEKNNWEDEILNISTQLNEYKSKYENQKLQIGEKERLILEKETLEERIKLQQTALSELKAEVGELTKQSEDKVTFVSCSDMDETYKAESKDNKNKISNYWIENIQQAIAQSTNNRLYYDNNTIRSFIAGLSMSRFSLLQGISGTGKTSLPKAFIKAIGGSFGIVEVQSGWKDRQDLIGYYNTFEKKYYEGQFLKLLYKAGTPKHKNKPFFIILDEMNLSHPEHYFADMLSIMEETNPEDQSLKICDKVNDIPKLMELKDGGIEIKIPQNVWFIGTANHDETTLQFAPKTYDRANILEMPINIDKFPIEPIESSKMEISNEEFLNFTEPNKGFDNTDTIEYLKADFKTICNKLGIGWGNRLEKQLKLFIPSFIALKGDKANALDHIIASKILRTIKGRYDLQEATLKEMKEELETNFKNKFKGDAEKSLKIVNDELSKF